MIGISKKLLKQQLRLFQLTSSSQAFDIPKRTGGEASFCPRQTVHVRAVNFVTTHERVFYQVFLYSSHRREPHRIHWTNKPHHGHQQRGCIQSLCSLRLHKRLQFVVPEIRKDVTPNLVPRTLPYVKWSRERA